MTATVCCRTAASTTFAQSVLAAIGGWFARVALGRMKRESEHGDTRDLLEMRTEQRNRLEGEWSLPPVKELINCTIVI